MAYTAPVGDTARRSDGSGCDITSAVHRSALDELVVRDVEEVDDEDVDDVEAEEDVPVGPVARLGVPMVRLADDVPLDAKVAVPA